MQGSRVRAKNHDVMIFRPNKNPYTARASRPGQIKIHTRLGPGSRPAQGPWIYFLFAGRLAGAVCGFFFAGPAGGGPCMDFFSRAGSGFPGFPRQT